MNEKYDEALDIIQLAFHDPLCPGNEDLARTTYNNHHRVVCSYYTRISSSHIVYILRYNLGRTRKSI